MRIIEEEEFGKMYGKAKHVLTEPGNQFYVDLLEQCTRDTGYGNYIYYANQVDKRPPVKSFLLLFKKEITEYTNGKIEDPNLRQSLGCFFAYLYTQKYNMSKAGAKQINGKKGILGVSVATYYKEN